MKIPRAFSATNKKTGDRFQLVVADGALRGAFVGSTKWLDALGTGLAGAKGGLGLVLCAVLLPVLAATGWWHWRREKAISVGTQRIGFEAGGFRLLNSQIEAVTFLSPTSGARFSGRWQLETCLKNGEAQVWTLGQAGVPRGLIEDMRGLEVPVHVV